MPHEWKVVPVSNNQKLDVREEDLLEGGLFRKCSTYRGGGGYDKFPEMCYKHLGVRHSEQFVVQLFGCNLDCPYCYVTREGVWGNFERLSTEKLIESFIKSGQETFHLMGGAPALQIEHWKDIIRNLPKETTFHSDLMLTEKVYKKEVLESIKSNRCLYAVSVKGLTEEEHIKNTRKPFNSELFYTNLYKLIDLEVPFYFTFTDVDKNNMEKFLEEFPDHDHFSIDLIGYNALPYVDSTNWGIQSGS